jgi:hypothetical protein
MFRWIILIVWIKFSTRTSLADDIRRVLLVLIATSLTDFTLGYSILELVTYRTSLAVLHVIMQRTSKRHVNNVLGHRTMLAHHVIHSGLILVVPGRTNSEAGEICERIGGRESKRRTKGKSNGES